MDDRREMRPFSETRREIAMWVDGRVIVFPAADYQISLLITGPESGMTPDYVTGAECVIEARIGKVDDVKCSFAEFVEGYEPPRYRREVSLRG